jgi:23S rRNA (guanine745-N1)-methyltransferase
MTDPLSALARISSFLACPVCAQPLQLRTRDNAQLTCVSHHSFDVARQGYANLLLSHQRKSDHPGYTQDMLRARRTVLQAGLFHPLLPVLVECIKPAIPHSSGLVLDAGCGEGSLFSHLLDDLQASGADLSGLGLDISKPGIRMAAAADKSTAWCVANLTRQLPILSGAVALLLNVLSPLNAEEFQRVLAKDGLLLKVFAGTDHLQELRAALYEVADPGPQLREEVTAQLVPFFTIVDTQQLHWVWPVAGVPLHDVLMMSPLFWKAKAEKIQQLEQNGLQEVTVDLELLVARPR